MFPTSAGALVMALTKPIGTTSLVSGFATSSGFKRPTDWDEFERVNRAEKIVFEGIQKGIRRTRRSTRKTGMEARVKIEDLPADFPDSVGRLKSSELTQVFEAVDRFHQRLARVIYRSKDFKIPQEYKELEEFLYEPSDESLTTENYEKILFSAGGKFEAVALLDLKQTLPRQWHEIITGERIIKSALKALGEARQIAIESSPLKHEDPIEFGIKSHLLKKVIWQRIIGGQKDLLKELVLLIESELDLLKEDGSERYSKLKESQLWQNARVMSDIQQVRHEIFTLLKYKDHVPAQWAGPSFDYAYVTDITPKANPFAKVNIAALTPERLNKIIQQILRETYAGGGGPAASDKVSLKDDLYTVKSYVDASYPDCYLYTDLKTEEKFRIRRVDRSNHDRSILLGHLSCDHVTRIYRIQHSVCSIKVPTEMPISPDFAAGEAAKDVTNGFVGQYAEYASKRKDHIWIVERYSPDEPSGSSSSLPDEYLGKLVLGGVSGLAELKAKKISLPYMTVKFLRGCAGVDGPVYKIDKLRDVLVHDELSPYRGHIDNEVNKTTKKCLRTFYESLVTLRPALYPIKSLIADEKIKDLAKYFNTTKPGATEDLVEGVGPQNSEADRGTPGARSDLLKPSQDSDFRPPDVFGDDEIPYWNEIDNGLVDWELLPETHHATSAAASLQPGLLSQCINFFRSRA